MSIDQVPQDAALRDLALDRLKKQADFKLHAMIYLLFNGFLVVIWWMMGSSFFWPVFSSFRLGNRRCRQLVGRNQRPRRTGRSGRPGRGPRCWSSEW